MKTHRIALSLIVLLAASACGRAASSPDVLSLDGTWKFQFAPDAKAGDALAAKPFFAADFDSSAFADIPVPANWNMCGFEDPYYVNGSPSEGFYLQTFDVPAGARGKRVLLHFDGVWESAEVWLNGQLLGRHDSGFTAFAFDVSRVLKAGETNRLAVRVRQQTPLFKLDANDDWALAGIYRSVWLEFTNKDLFIESVDVRTDFDEAFCDATLAIRAFVMRDAKADFFANSPPFELRAILSTIDGTEVQRATFSGPIQGAHNGRDIPIDMLVREPAPWTAETPNLYTLRLELVDGDKVVHTWEDRVGFREVSTAGGVLRVNGQIVKLRGVARHDQHPDVGRATRPEHWLEEIKLMKAGNINAVRTAHYPPNQGFIRLCDEMGIYVIEEVPFGFGGDRMSDPAYAEGVFLRVHETLARDRNRPSVIVWSVGNEDPFSSLHLAALRAIKGLDPTRPTLLPFRYAEWLPPEVDILAPHYWNAADYDRVAAVSRRPIVTTEYTHALGPDDFGEMEQRWDALTQHPAGAGGMIWLWADQGLRRKIDGRPVMHPMRGKSGYTREGGELVREADAGPGEIYDSHGNYGTDGIIDANRTPQRDYWEAKAVYAPVRVLVDRVPLAAGQESVSIPVRNDFDFTDLSTVGVKWELFRDADVVASGNAALQAVPHQTVDLVVPTTPFATADAGGVRYLRVTFLRPDGSEITQRSVRLGFESAPQPGGPCPAGTPLKVANEGNLMVVAAGAARYTFNKETGEIAGMTLGSTELVRSSNLVVWRSATYCERNRLDRRPNQHDWDTYMQGLAPKVLDWTVSQRETEVAVRVRSEYRTDDLNSVVAETTYTVTPTGVLRVELAVEPHMDVPWLPEIGLEFALAGKPGTLTWLGEGPLDSLPNKTAATTFGWWSAPIGSDAARGTKSVLEWARVAFADAVALQARGCAGVRLVTGPEGDLRLRVLSNLAGAWTKNGPPERPEWQLDLEKTKSFHGSFELVPVPTDSANR